MARLLARFALTGALFFGANTTRGAVRTRLGRRVGLANELLLNATDLRETLKNVREPRPTKSLSFPQLLKRRAKISKGITGDHRLLRL
jgi:hypothetical protein